MPEYEIHITGINAPLDYVQDLANRIAQTLADTIDATDLLDALRVKVLSVQREVVQLARQLSEEPPEVEEPSYVGEPYEPEPPDLPDEGDDDHAQWLADAEEAERERHPEARDD